MDPALDTPTVAAGVDQLATLLLRLVPRGQLSLVAAATLATLEREGRLRLTDLAERQAVTQPAMTGLARRLAAAGLIERHPDPDDRRSVRIDVTETGRRLIAQRRSTRAAALAALIDELDPTDQAAIAAAVPAITRLVARSTATGAALPTGAPA